MRIGSSSGIFASCTVSILVYLALTVDSQFDFGFMVSV